MAFDVSNLNAYVEQNRMGLIGKAILRGKTIEVINHMSGVKGSATLNLLDVDVTFQDGSNCAFNPSGNDEFSQRTLETKLVTVQKEWCWKDLIGTFAQVNDRVRVTAGEDKALPFEEFISTKLLEGINAEIEKIAWQGKASSPAIAGLLAQFTAASQTISASTGATDLANVKEVYANIPEEVLDKAVIFVGADVFRGMVNDLVNSNLYHYDPKAPIDEVVLPGTNTRVIKVNGLNNATEQTKTKLIVAADPDKLFYGYDIEDSARAFKFGYDEKADTLWFRMLTNMGFQIAIPTEVIIYGQ